MQSNTIVICKTIEYHIGYYTFDMQSTHIINRLYIQWTMLILTQVWVSLSYDTHDHSDIVAFDYLSLQWRLSNFELN
jgi:hypothetical protein